MQVGTQKKNVDLLSDLVQQFKSQGVRSSIFCDTNLMNIEFAAKTGVDRIELYTGPYAENYIQNPTKAIQEYIQAAEFAHSLGIGINAGHDLSLENLKFFKSSIPFLAEVSIGHALISDALYFGLENTIQRYKFMLT